jgi:hypothetical protein
MRQSACLRTGRFTEEGATMSTQSLLTWVVLATARLLPSQSRTLAVLVAAATGGERDVAILRGKGDRVLDKDGRRCSIGGVNGAVLTTAKRSARGITRARLTGAVLG